MRRCSQWLQYEGLRYAVEATLRRGAGTIPWQLNEPYPNAWCTCAVDHRGDPKPATGASPGRTRARRAPVRHGRLGRPRRGARDGHVAGAVRRPRRARRRRGRRGRGRRAAGRVRHDVFLLDLGRNRYVMTRAETLEPLLDLPRAELAFAGGVLRNVGTVAALGIVLEDARPYDDPGWITFSDNVLDLLPGEERAVEVGGPVGELRDRGLECRRLARSRRTGPASTASASRAPVSPTRAPRRSRREIRFELERARPTTRVARPGVFYGENRPEAAPASTRATRPDAATSTGWSRLVELPRRPLLDTGRVRERARLAHERGQPRRPGWGRLAWRRPPGRVARLPLPRGAAPLRRLRDAGGPGCSDVPLAAGRVGRARRARGRA